MEEKKMKYPIGDQDFKSIIEGGFLYVDKTSNIEKILEGNKYYFLARPRRFGKSLFLSTLRYFFEARRDFLDADWDLDELAGLDLLNADPTALLYQAGYLTIADYDIDTNTVRLKVPNEEVRKGLFKDLLDAYLKPKRGTVKSIIEGIKKGINSGQPEMVMKNLDAFLAGIPYDLKLQNEINFQNVFYVLATLLDMDVKAEVHTSDGRIDLLIQTPGYVYIIELKYNGTSPPQPAASKAG